MGPNVNAFEQELERFVCSQNVKIEKCNNDNIICQTSESSVAYVNGVSEALFKVGMCLPAEQYVTDDDVKYIVETIKENIVG